MKILELMQQVNRSSKVKSLSESDWTVFKKIIIFNLLISNSK
jgi:hypothetical protein